MLIVLIVVPRKIPTNPKYLTKIKEAIDSCRFDYDFEYSINNLKRIINI